MERPLEQREERRLGGEVPHLELEVLRSEILALQV